MLLLVMLCPAHKNPDRLPFIGWVCGAGFALQFVVGPLGEWISTLAGHPVKLPQLGLSTMMPMPYGMPGMKNLNQSKRSEK
jgi:hypothetical protein